MRLLSGEKSLIPRMRGFLQKDKLPPLLFALLLVALGLRLYGINWDQGYLFHPDERQILMKVGELSFPAASNLRSLLDPQASPLNPHWFNYGSFPLYLLKLLRSLLGFLGEEPSIYDLRLPGRALSAIFDTGTVLVTYLLASRLYSRRVGFLAAVFVAFSVINIQLSHFYTTEVLLTFFTVLSVLFMARFMERGDLGSICLAGLFVGLALATKVSIAPILFTAFVACFLYCFTKERLSASAFSIGRVPRALLGLLLGGFVTLAAFSIAQPYAIIDWRTFLGDVLEQSEMVRRVRDYPYTRQYVDTAPYLYHIQQLSVWGLGLPLGIAAWSGAIFSTLSAVVRRQRGNILLLSWALPYLLITGGFQVKFLRYLLPIVPFLSIMAAGMLVTFWDRARSKKVNWARIVAWGAIAVVVFSTFFYALAYVNIYSTPHTAVRMSQWINGNVLKGSQILVEHWEERVPRLADYSAVELPNYDSDNPSKKEFLVQKLEEADYVLFYSNRLYGTIPRLKERYPMTSRYYELLFSGRLGFEMLHYETSYPNLLGIGLVDNTFARPGLPSPAPPASYRPSPITLDMGYADESFTVYDHPKVMLFKKVERLDRDKLKALLEEGQEPKVGLLFSESDARVYREGGTWSEIFQRDSIANRLPAISWILVIELLSLIALPLGLYLFRNLSDRGYLLSKSLGILLVSYLTWLSASMRWLPFSRSSIVLGLGIVALVSLLLYIRFRGEMNAFLRARWRLLVFGEALFLLSFLLFYAIRLLNPDLWHPFRGGEKPMDFAYLNAVIRSVYMPPYDPWFSGGYLNYYYFGQFIVAVLRQFSGVVPSVAFNLAVPLLFALTFTGVFSVVYNLVERDRGGGLEERGFWRRIPSPLLAGFAGSIFVVVIANLDGLAQLAQGIWAVVARHQPFPVFDYWRSSRMMPPDPPGFEITEFPFFTFLFADPHAHLIAIPFTVLTIGLVMAFALGARPQEDTQVRSNPVHWLALLLILPIVLGALRITNTWDFPTYLLVSAGGVAIYEYSRRGKMDARFFVWTALTIVALYVLSTFYYLPFHRNYEAFYGGVEPSRTRTALWQYLAIHGIFIFLIASFLVAKLRQASKGRIFALKGATFIALSIAVVLFLGSLVLLGLATVAFIFVLLFLVVALVVWQMRAPLDEVKPSQLFVLMLLTVTLLIGIGVDVVTVQGDIERMNTVFKFYLQAWVLLGIVSAYSLWGLKFGKAVRPHKWGLVWWIAFAILIIGSLIYPFAATPVRIKDRFLSAPPTPDGMAYMQWVIYWDEKGPIELRWDYDAILELQDKVQGSPVILEGVTPLYRWGSRISIYTGLPTVVGWDWHQKQQRWGYTWAVDERLGDVKAMYGGLDQEATASLLRKYNVGYVYLGELERLYFPGSQAKFDGMLGKYLEVFYENPRVRVYKVKG
ncbi:MAG: glycosyltransferase family 39 protein [Chloroflexi bacterium]|nr:glycosyltransferase family 39 protein [Chloroflexota bacterium]